MSAFVADNLIVRFREHAHTDLVGHGPRWAKNAGIHSNHSCQLFLQPFYRRVLAEDIIADIGAAHSVEHSRSGLRHSITSQIDGHGLNLRGFKIQKRRWEYVIPSAVA